MADIIGGRGDSDPISLVHAPPKHDLAGGHAHGAEVGGGADPHLPRADQTVARVGAGSAPKTEDAFHQYQCKCVKGEGFEGSHFRVLSKPNESDCRHRERNGKTFRREKNRRKPKFDCSYRSRKNLVSALPEPS